MKIKNKMIIIFVSAGLCFLLTIWLNNAAMNRISEIRKERDELEKMKTLILESQVSIQRINIRSVLTEMKVFEEIHYEVKQKDKDIRELKRLPVISSEMRNAYLSVLKLIDLYFQQAEDIQDKTAVLLASAQPILGVVNEFKLNDIYTETRILQHDEYNSFSAKVISYSSAIEMFAAFMTTTISSIESQLEKIDTIIRLNESRTTLLSLVFGGIQFIFLFIFAIIFSLQMNRRFGKLRQRISVLTSGNLCDETRLDVNDEIGDVFRHLASFQSHLNGAFSVIKQLNNENHSLEETLNASVEETSAATTQMDANIQSIKGQIEKLDSITSVSCASSREIGNDFIELNQQISDQNQDLQKTVQSLANMVNSIELVDNEIRHGGDIAKNMNQNAEKSYEMINLSKTMMNEVGEKIEGISDIVDIINNIASQTNLLAMNAAIEAAHAGDMGKGFGVVADEIRKLAEATSDNAKSISKNLQGVISISSQAQSASEGSQIAYQKIVNNINETTSVFGRIETASSSLGRESRLIVTALDELKAISDKVQNNTETFSQSNNKINREIESISQISELTHSGINEISEGVKEISAVMHGILDNLHDVMRMNEELETKLSFYRTTDKLA